MPVCQCSACSAPEPLARRNLAIEPDGIASIADGKGLECAALGTLIHIHHGPAEILQTEVRMFDGPVDTLAPLENSRCHVCS